MLIFIDPGFKSIYKFGKPRFLMIFLSIGHASVNSTGPIWCSWSVSKVLTTRVPKISIFKKALLHISQRKQ